MQNDQSKTTKVVPLEPTDQMIKAGQRAYEPDYEYGLTDEDIILVYKAMITEAV